MDYFAAAAAAIIGMGATWALDIISSAAELQANKARLREPIYNLTVVIPFTETIFLPQSMIMTALLIVVSIAIAFWSATKGNSVKTIDQFDIQLDHNNKKKQSHYLINLYLANLPRNVKEIS